MSQSSVKKAAAPSLANGSHAGKSAPPAGSRDSHAAAINNLVAPPGKSLYFTVENGRPVAYEFRNGKAAAPTWGKGGQRYYRRGSSFAVGKLTRKQLLAQFPAADLGPEAKAGWRLFQYLVLQEGQEQFETGLEIVDIQAPDGDGWNGTIEYRPYYIASPSEKRHYGPTRRMSHDELQGFFGVASIGSGLADTAEKLETAVVFMVEVANSVGPGGAILTGAKTAGKKAAAGALKQLSRKAVSSPTSRKALKKTLAKIGKVLDHLVAKAAIEFALAVGLSLLKDAQNRPEVIKAALDGYVWPGTPVVGKTGQWMIQWEQALIAGVKAAAAQMVGKPLEDAITKHTDVNAEVRLALGAMDLHDVEFLRDMEKLLWKWVVTDNVTGVVKIIGAAAGSATSRDDFPAKLRDALKGELKGRFAGAFKEFAGLHKR